MGSNAAAMPNFYETARQNAQVGQPAAAAAPAAQNPFQTPLWGGVPQQGATPMTSATPTTPSNGAPPLPGLPTGQSVPDANLGNTSSSLAGQVNQNLSSPMDWSGFMPGGTTVQGGNYYNDTATNAVKDKFDLWNNDQFNTDENRLRTQLLNSGVNPSDASYDEQLTKLRETQGKLRASSALDAITAGQNEAANLQGMDIDAGNYNTNQRNNQVTEAITRRELPLNEKTALDNSRAPDQNTNASKIGSVLEGIPGVINALTPGANGSSLVGTGIDAASGLINKLTGGATTGLGTKLAGGAASALGGGLASAGAINAGLAGTSMAGLGGELATATNAAAPGLISAMGGGTAAAEGTGLMSGLASGVGNTVSAIGTGVSSALSSAYTALASMGPVGWIGAAAIAAGTAIAAGQPKSSPLNKFDSSILGWTKGENFDDSKYTAQELNDYYGPALKTFAETGDATKALAVLPQPSNATQQKLAKGAKHLFSGSGNPFRQIAKDKGFGEGIWTAGNKEKKAAIKAVGG